MLAGGTVFNRLLFSFILILISINYLTASIKVDKIVFEGNISFENSQLKKIIKSQEKEEFDNKILRIDKIILQNFYLGQGFLKVWVESELLRRGDKITIIFKLSEGIRFVLGEISISGAAILPEEEFRKFFDLKNGDFFKSKKIEDGTNKIEEFYYNHGKPYVEISDKQIIEDSLINIQIYLKENETVYIHDIDYIGLKHVKSFIIGRELEIFKKDIYSRQKIEKSQRNIYGTGLFNFVGIELKALDSTRSSANLLITVVEKDSRWIGARFGIGYEQEIVYGGTFDFTLEFGHRNLFGTARSIYISLIPSFSYDFEDKKFRNPKNQYSFTYIEPWIGYTRTPGIFRISFIQARPLYSANYDYLTTSFLVQHQFENLWEISGKLAYDQVKILEEDTLDQATLSLTQGQDYIYALTGRLVKDKRDNYLNPKNGSITDLHARIAYSKSRNAETGETTKNRFIRATFEWNRYQSFRFQKNWVLASRVKLGNIFEFGRRSQIPISERFFLGGASTVRGYKEQLLGPSIYDETRQYPRAIGGKLMFLANIELRIPMFWIIWGETFFDAGNVWLENKNFRINEIKTTSGIGLALLTPLGPIRFDYGLKHRPTDNESAGEFHISIAFAF